MEMPKLLTSLADENRGVHKQMGCIKGFFQLFDRHHFFSRRRFGGHHQNRAPPGQSVNHEMEFVSTARMATEKNLEETGKGKQRAFVESARTSLSSSSGASTISSTENNRTAPQEPPSLCHTIAFETQPQILPIEQPSSSLHAGRQSLDLRDVVKDSIYRETRGLSVKIATKGEKKNRGMKHIDSPRPSLPGNPVKPKASALDGFRVLAKLRDPPRISNAEKDGPSSSTAKEDRRFSCDGRESPDTLKSNLKFKELPRLSLDSRAGSMRSPASESRLASLLGESERRNWSSHQEPGSNERPSSVVAKLMGLRAFPDFASINEVSDTNSRSSRMADESKHSQVSESPRSSKRDPASPCLINANSVTQPNSSSRLPLEPARSRRPEGNRSSQKSLCSDANTKDLHFSSSDCGEIEKLLSELEFKKSGNDLRALKQILGAMQKSRERFGSRESNIPISPTCRGSSSHLNKFECPAWITTPARLMKSRTIGSATCPKVELSGPRAKLRTGEAADSGKDSDDKKPAMDQTLRNNHPRKHSCGSLLSKQKSTASKTLRSIQTSKATPHIKEENSPSQWRGLGAMSPKRLGQEKRSHPSTQSSDLNRTRKTSSKQLIEASSPIRRLKPRSSTLQQGDEQSNKNIRETKTLSRPGDVVSMQSESKFGLALQMDTDVNEINGIYQPDWPNRHIAARMSQDKSVAEIVMANLEQPSPVSVLDTTFYREESPSPVKKMLNAFKGEVLFHGMEKVRSLMLIFDRILNSDEAERNSVELEPSLDSTRSNLSSEFDPKTLEYVKHLAYQLRHMNSPHDEATISSIAYICKNTNPDHRYITEIMLASGLLLNNPGSTLTATKLPSSGHLIHPGMFFVLEQSRENSELSKDENSNEKIARSKFNEKVQRKLIFDTVNEILVRKFALPGSSELWVSPNRLRGRSLGRQNILKDLCSEMDHLQDTKADRSISMLSEDLMYKSENWEDCHGEIPGIVLYIERQIFKDLITEVVVGNATDLQGQLNRHCRQLFSK